MVDVTARRAAEDALAHEVRERVAIADSIRRIEAGSTPEETAAAVCGEAAQLPGIDGAGIVLLESEAGAVTLAAEGTIRAIRRPGQQLSSVRARALRERAARGPWVESWSVRSPDPYERSVAESGIVASIQVPLTFNGRLLGTLTAAVTSPDEARSLPERLPAVLELAAVAGVLLGPALAAGHRTETSRRAIEAVIEHREFDPVFHPIIELATDWATGFEALTRFRDGKRPDVRFAEAAALGLGMELEAACLRESVRAAGGLPVGRWLALNVSASMLVAREPLRSILDLTDRPVILEVTEHVAVDDYDALRAAVAALRPGVELAVDDVGAGYAGLRHALQLAPDIVKMDLSLTRDVDRDAGKRALASALISFADETGMTIVAEGIETAGELDALRELGVRFGQGFYLAEPSPLD